MRQPRPVPIFQQQQIGVHVDWLSLADQVAGAHHLKSPAPKIFPRCRLPLRWVVAAIRHLYPQILPPANRSPPAEAVQRICDQLSDLMLRCEEAGINLLLSSR